MEQFPTVGPVSSSVRPPICSRPLTPICSLGLRTKQVSLTSCSSTNPLPTPRTHIAGGCGSHSDGSAAASLGWLWPPGTACSEEAERLCPPETACPVEDGLQGKVGAGVLSSSPSATDSVIWCWTAQVADAGNLNGVGNQPRKLAAPRGVTPLLPRREHA